MGAEIDHRRQGRLCACRRAMHPSLRPVSRCRFLPRRKQKEAAYLFIQWLNSEEISLERVQLPYALRDPFRDSHFTSAEYRGRWGEAGEYLDALKAGAVTGLLDLSIIQTDRYEEALRQGISRLWAGDDPQTILNDVAAQWDTLTDRIGVDTQKAAYGAWAAKPNAYPIVKTPGPVLSSGPAVVVRSTMSRDRMARSLDVNRRPTVPRADQAGGGMTTALPASVRRPQFQVPDDLSGSSGDPADRPVPDHLHPHHHCPEHQHDGRGHDVSGCQTLQGMLADTRFWESLLPHGDFPVIALPIELLLGLALAYLFLDHMPGKQMFVALLVLPVIISPIVAGATWRLLFDTRFGPINQILGWFSANR